MLVFRVWDCLPRNGGIRGIHRGVCGPLAWLIKEAAFWRISFAGANSFGSRYLTPDFQGEHVAGQPKALSGADLLRSLHYKSPLGGWPLHPSHLDTQRASSATRIYRFLSNLRIFQVIRHIFMTSLRDLHTSSRAWCSSRISMPWREGGSEHAPREPMETLARAQGPPLTA